MDYIGNKCPVCEKYFHVGDDVVVCPECGTPHHRECYNKNGHCINNDKHQDGYDYLEDINSKEGFGNSSNCNQDSEDFGLTVCKKCGAKNANGAFFCSNCGNILNEQENLNQTNQAYQQANNQDYRQNSPFGSSPNVVIFDPLAGVSPNTDLGDGVTVAETAKYVKQNTPYFITIFNNIKNFSKSRFNFCAAIFGGGYLLYRKMYKLGAIITIIEAAIMIFTTYLAQYISTNAAFTKLYEAYASYDINATMMHFSNLSTYDTIIMYLYVLLSLGSLALSIVIGACANRMYFVHCKKNIKKIKNTIENPADVDSSLSKKGGVNVGLAISLWVSYIIISYLPYFFYQ